MWRWRPWSTREAYLIPSSAQIDAAAMLRWLVEAGADEALEEAPVDRYLVPAAVEAVTARVAARSAAILPARVAPAPSGVAVTARDAAAACTTLDELRAAIAGFKGCVLSQTAKNMVFADGVPGAGVMFIGEAPGRDEDLQGLPFVGRSGMLLDRMLKAISLDRTMNAYITNVIFWRPPGNRPPTTEEAAICAPFLVRHIELQQPRVLVLLGGTPLKHVLNADEGITRVRGRWGRYVSQGREIPCLPMFHPSYLLRQPSGKKQAWQDLLSLKGKLRELGVI